MGYSVFCGFMACDRKERLECVGGCHRWGGISHLRMLSPWVREETCCYRTEFMLAGRDEALTKDCVRVGVFFPEDITGRNKLERKYVCAS